MDRTGSSQIATASFLLIGIIVGAGLVFGTLYATDSLSARTVTLPIVQTSFITQTMTQTTTVTIGVTTTTTVSGTGSFISSATITVSTVNVSHTLSGTALALGACTAAAPAGNYIAAQNTGTATTSTTNVQFTYGGVTSNVAYTCTLTVGSTMYIPVTDTGTTVATAGEAFTGALSLANGGTCPFTGEFT